MHSMMKKLSSKLKKCSNLFISTINPKKPMQNSHSGLIVNYNTISAAFNYIRNTPHFHQRNVNPVL